MTQREKILCVFRAYFSRERKPRLVIVVILVVTAGSGFLCSRSLMIWGVQSMGLRYLISTLVAWAAFIGLVRLWVEIERRCFRPSAQYLQAADRHGESEDGYPVADTISELASSVLNGDPNPRISLVGFVLFVIVSAVILLVVGIVLGIASLVAGAPALLAEVFLDVVVAACLTRRLPAHEARWWALSMIGRTWKLALALTCALTLFGWVIQSWGLAVRSLGDLFNPHTYLEE